MTKYLSYLKNPAFLSVLGLLSIILLVWFAFPEIKFGENNLALMESAGARAITIIIIMLLWGLNNLRIQQKTRKGNDELVEDINHNNVESARDYVSEQSTEELNLLNKRFSDALNVLKNVKFTGKNSNKGLYELPWYIIIGPPGSGKTTALINSSLQFPLADKIGEASLQGVGGTRNCDWWFTNDAVLIDTAGRYTTQDSHQQVDSKAWEGFLSLLKRNRRRRPINGAIVAISVYDLLLMTDDERSRHALSIRNRLDELMKKLEIRFPVYLMFTKTDLVSGFDQYFSDMSRQEREQVWGITLSDKPENVINDDIQYIKQQYKSLVDRLYERLIPRLHNERDVNRRVLIQGFPQQMENLTPVIENFLTQVFTTNRFSENPYLRGIYFTSGTQNGTPIDRLMSSVSSSFGFAESQSHPVNYSGKSYFLGGLFKNVIFPESELVGINRKYETIFIWLQRTAVATIAFSVIGLFLIWFGTTSRHQLYMMDVQEIITDYKTDLKRFNAWSQDIRTLLPVLNQLAKASVIYDQDEHPWLSGLGLYDGSVDNNADKAYITHLNLLLLPKLKKYLESSLVNSGKDSDIYSTFRSYMMFRNIGYLDKNTVITWFRDNMLDAMKGEATVRKQIESHIVALMNSELESSKLSENIVKDVRRKLLRVPVSKRIYSRLKADSSYNQKLNLLNVLGESVETIFVGSTEQQQALELSPLFTKEIYDSIDISKDSPLLTSLIDERWVLDDGNSNKVDFVKEDLDEISENIKQHYQDDYINAWKKVFSALKIRPFSNIKQATDVISELKDPVFSPFVSILQASSLNTQLSNQLFANLSDDYNKGVTGKTTALLNDTFKGTKVDIEFRELNKLLRENGKKPALITNILADIENLYGFVNEVNNSPDSDKKSFEIVKTRYSKGNTNPITNLISSSSKYPEPVARWLNELSMETWGLLLKNARNYINQEWQNLVYKPYNDGLAGRYPLNRSSRDELAIYDFSSFFKPAGVIDKFFENNIRPFISTRENWQNKIVDNLSLGLSNQSLSQIRKSQQIKEIFFQNNPETPQLDFQMKPQYLGKNSSRFTIELGADRLSYSHGPKFWKNVSWVGDDQNSRVRIIFEDLQEGLHSQAFDGPWAWFKLQDMANVTKTRKSNVYLANYKLKQDKENSSTDDLHVAKFALKARSIKNPFNNELLGNFRCPQSL